MTIRNHELIGTTIGSYSIEQVIGAGGMGVVYLAQETRPSRYVAVKVLRTHSAPYIEDRQEFLQRFRREADVVAKLDHMNIMPIYSYGEENGLAFLVMPYLAGGSLRDLLSRCGTLSLLHTLTYIEQAAAALDYAHAHGIVHRDIKPGNFLFHTDGRLVLADFGIAHLRRDSGMISGSTITGTGLFLGSPEYMAPEMIRGGNIDQRSDIYGLGIVLFQMLSGQVPFQGDTAYIVAAKHLQESVPLLYQLNPAIPPIIDAVVRKALAKRREDRYKSAGELAQALRAALTMPYSTSWNNALDTFATVSVSQSAVSLPITPNYMHAQHLSDAIQENDISDQATGPLHTAPRSMSRWLTLIGIFLFLGLTLFLTVPLLMKGALTGTKVTSTVTPITALSQKARAIVNQYYGSINGSYYQDAYQLWGAGYQSSHPYAQFANSFANVKYDDIVFHSKTPLADGTVRVEITVYQTEASSYGIVINTLQGSYIVGQENSQWRLLTSNLQFAGTEETLTPSQQDRAQVQGIVQLYYNDINQSNFKDAYQLWGNDHQSVQPYSQFASGYANTKHDEITFDSITQLSNGVFKVAVTIYATEGTASGTVLSTFRGSYIVGQEQGALKLLIASFHKVG